MKKNKKESKDGLIKEALDNIRTDRGQAQLLLTKLLEGLLAKEQTHRDVGLIAANYLQTLQRSNEQLVKLIQAAKVDDATEELSEEEKEQMFDDLIETEE